MSCMPCSLSVMVVGFPKTCHLLPLRKAREYNCCYLFHYSRCSRKNPAPVPAVLFHFEPLSRASVTKALPFKLCLPSCWPIYSKKQSKHPDKNNVNSLPILAPWLSYGAFSCSKLGAVFAFSLDWIELALPQTERFRSNFKKLIVEQKV